MVASGWYATGRTLGVALDADKGTMLVTGGDENNGTWVTAFESGVRPSATVGGGLYPCISGHTTPGAVVQINLGLDPSRPMVFAPPTPEFRPAGKALSLQVDACASFGYGYVTLSCIPLQDRSDPSWAVSTLKALVLPSRHPPPLSCRHSLLPPQEARLCASLTEH